jgi:hypothetical protein
LLGFGKEQPMATRRSLDTPGTPESRAPSAEPKRPRAARGKIPARDPVSAEDRRAMIAEAAYLRAEGRGFAPGHETEDWLAAELEVDALLQFGPGGAAQ